jgi:hypothetical protein
MTLSLDIVHPDAVGDMDDFLLLTTRSQKPGDYFLPRLHGDPSRFG